MFFFFFIDLDLALQPRNNHVKLHVTLMNTGFYKYQCSVNGDSTKKTHLTFDARKIIEVSIVTIVWSQFFSPFLIYCSCSDYRHSTIIHLEQYIYQKYVCHNAIHLKQMDIINHHL